MRQVRELSEKEKTDLEQLHRSGTSHRERVRAHAVLLSAKGFEVETLAVIFSVDRDTASRWLERFEQGGVVALCDANKSGRPRKITPEAEAILQEHLQNPTPNLKPQLLERLKKGASVSAGKPSPAP
jgi:transposase